MLDWVKNIKNVPLVKRYAQFCEENIFDYIFENIGTTNKYLVDFGANGLNQGLSNSKYLLEEKGWSGLLMDGNNSGNDLIKQEFITAENICSLFHKYKVPFGFDLLSIDLDGNDFWVLLEILAGPYLPRVIILEFNGTLPVDSCIAMKYNPAHTWGEDNYYGASFSAFRKMLAEYEYTLVYQVATTNMIFIHQSEVPKADYGITYTPSMYHKQNTTGEWVHV